MTESLVELLTHLVPITLVGVATVACVVFYEWRRGLR